MSEPRSRAVVVGAGIAGVAVARVLADRFQHVIVLDRDPHVVPRPHVPQQPHTHILGAHGFRVFSRLFDNFDADLAAEGAPRFDFGESPFFAGRWAPRRSFGLISRSCTRPVFEKVTRRRLLAHPRVELLTKRVRDFLLVRDRVTGVRLDDGRELTADLVVDAAGAGSKTPEWLAQHGFPSPPRTELDLDGGVVSQLFRPARERRLDWALLNVRRSMGNTRHGVISLVEDGIWRVSFAGAGGKRPPKDLPGLLDYARAITPPIIAELLVGAEPVAPPSRYGNMWSQWIHYERLPRFPDGLVVVGDATFHPNYEHGQGMTFCAMTAELLGEHLDRHALGLERDSSRAFQRAFGAMVAPYWDWNISSELATVPGLAAPAQSRATAIRHRFYQTIRQAGLRDPDLWKTVIEVTQSVRSPRSLLHPTVLRQALSLRLRPAAPQRPDAGDYEWLLEQVAREEARRDQVETAPPR